MQDQYVKPNSMMEPPKVQHVEPCFAGDMPLTRTSTFDNDN